MEQQTYSNWELCLADGSPEPLKEIQSMIKKDSRIKYKFLNKNNGIADNTNEALKLATGDFIALMDHDDILSIDCLFENVKAINENPNVEFLYSDEDKIYKIGSQRFGAYFKPDFAIDTLRSGNYICHFSVFKKELMEKLEGERGEYDGAQDFDIILRMAEKVKKENIIHISKILYHWRLSETSTAANADAKPYAYIAGAKAVKDHLKRIGLDATVSRSKYFGLYDTIYKVHGNPKVNILIMNNNGIKSLKCCVKSILEKTKYQNYEIDIICRNNDSIDYYNEIKDDKKIKIIKYKEEQINNSKIINYGIKHTDGEFILLLDSRSEVIEETWLEKLLGDCQRNDVGVVGNKLLYPDDTVYHAGIILGMNKLIGYIHKGIPDDDPGFFARAIIRQNVTAITGKCLMTKRKILEEVDYLNENLKNVLNDIDLCLRIIQKGYLIVYNPASKLLFYEEKEDMEKNNEDIELFKKIWKDEMEKLDPYYNKNLDLSNTYCIIKTQKVN